jgi:divinyl protochlorophyllide a 8-vinyl-reductase
MATDAQARIGPNGSARIGPNAITRVEAALTAQLGEEACLCVFSRAGLLRHLANPPTDMVPEADVMRLHAELHDALPAAEADAVAAEAGRQTADYLLRVRIPRLAQMALRLLPKATAALLFTRAIARHAWTFGGSGRFSATRDAGGLVLLITDNPAARGYRADRPSCHYFAETFRGLYTAILGPRVRVVETQCEAAGAEACRFRVTWR